MADQWYYGRDGEILGPFTSVQLKELATTGTIHPTDMIWKNDIAAGVAAAKVKKLFSEDQVRSAAEESVSASMAGEVAAATESADGVGEPPQTSEAEESAPESAPADARASEGGEQTDAAPPPSYSERPKRVIQATGAIILSQDGKNVRFRKKCVKCGQDDRSRTTMPIRPGTMRVGFYCPKCKKLQTVLIQSC
jgi:hypothetical protein